MELARSQKFLVDQVNKLYSVTNEYARVMIRHNFSLNCFSTHAASKKAAIESLRFGLINNRKINLQALNSLLDTNLFENIDSSTMEIISVEKFSKEGFTIRFFGHNISENKGIYEVKTLDHWVNTTSSRASLLKYAGPPKVLVNIDNNCVMGL